MENTAHAVLSVWEAYYVILGSSAAVLTGLQFVVIALIAETPALRSADSVGAFGTPTVVHFCFCLFVAALLSAPWTSLTPVTVLLLGAGAAGAAYTLIVFRRARRQITYRPVAEDWLWHVIVPLIAYGALIAAGVFLSWNPAAVLFVVGGVALTLIFTGIHNAWDAIAYVAVQQGSKQGNQIHE